MWLSLQINQSWVSPNTSDYMWINGHATLLNTNISKKWLQEIKWTLTDQICIHKKVPINGKGGQQKHQWKSMKMNPPKLWLLEIYSLKLRTSWSNSVDHCSMSCRQLGMNLEWRWRSGWKPWKQKGKFLKGILWVSNGKTGVRTSQSQRFAKSPKTNEKKKNNNKKEPFPSTI